MSKFASGRFILTVACAIAFLYVVWTGALEAAAISAILVSVFKDYFNRGDRNNGVDKLPN